MQKAPGPPSPGAHSVQDGLSGLVEDPVFRLDNRAGVDVDQQGVRSFTDPGVVVRRRGQAIGPEVGEPEGLGEPTARQAITITPVAIVVALRLTPGALVVVLLRGSDLVGEGLRRIVMPAARAAMLAAVGYGCPDSNAGYASRNGDVRTVVAAASVTAGTSGRKGVGGSGSRVGASGRPMEAAASRRRANVSRWRNTAVEAATAAGMSSATTGMGGSTAAVRSATAAAMRRSASAATVVLLSERAGPAKQGQGACRRH